MPPAGELTVAMLPTCKYVANCLDIPSKVFRCSGEEYLVSPVPGILATVAR